MTIIEYIKNEHSKIKARPKEERWAYFWEYYKFHLIIFVLVVALLVQGIISVTNKKEIVFSGFWLNSKINIDDDSFVQGFYDYAGIDAEKEEAAFYIDVILTDQNTKNDLTAMQRIMAGIAVKDTDFIAAPQDSFRVCAYSSSRIYMDLREFLDADTLETYAGRLYYIDGAILQKLSAPVGELVDTSSIVYPDPTKPETMQDPIPVGIDVSSNKDLMSAYYLTDTTVYLAVISNTVRPELTRQFLEYLET